MSKMVAGDPMLSIEGGRIPMTMQAEVEHLTEDQAASSALFDLPDKPGMVRVPVVIHLPVTPELAEMIEQAQAASITRQPSEPAASTPPARRLFAQGGVPKTLPR